MVHSDSGSNILIENSVSVVAADNSVGHRGSPSLRREPSFSGWCNSSKLHADRESLENANLNLDKKQEGVGSGETDSDFELPLLNQEQSFSSPSCSSFSMESRVIDGANGHIQYTTFDVENASKVEQNLSTLGDDSGVVASGNGTTHFTRNYDGSTPHSTKTVSTANVLKTLFFVMLWYTFSLFLTMYNKALLGDHLGKFPAPLLMNTLHFSMQAVLSRAIIWFWSDKYQTDVTISWKDYFARVVPTAFATALDINLSNASLVFISVTFATMCKSAAPIFLLLFAFALRLESPSFKLFGIILVISFGVLLTVAKETEFEFWGFVFVMLAAVMSGFRWCMIQILLQREKYGLKNPIVFMSSVTPVMALATGLMSLALDPWHEFAKNVYFNSSQHIFRSCLLMLFGGTLAFFMVLVEFVLISVTSAVTVTIAGVVKEALTIVVAVLYFHDEFTWVKGIGLLVIMFGVSLFNWYKYLKIQSGHGAEDETEQSVTSGTKYVILDKMEDQDDNM